MLGPKLEQWLAVSGLDGFNLAYTVMPESVEEFVDLAIPVLQERGVFKGSYQAGTFREKLGFKEPRLQAPHPGAGYRR